jgi:hypothetical protein
MPLSSRQKATQDESESRELPGQNGTAREAEPLPDWATEALGDEPGD